MCNRTVLSALTFVILVGTPMVLRGQKETPSPGLTIRQEVDSEMMNLSRNLLQHKSLKEKFLQLEKTLFVIKTVRKKSPRLLTDDQIYLDNLVSSVTDFPMFSEFKKESCPDYERKLIHRWDRRPPLEAEAPVLKRTLNILEGLCSIE